tara:strand:- start:65 stop:262 length:198 start_codon:yes stop_codon:yes gene_type:complete
MKTSKSNYRYPLATRPNIVMVRIATVLFFVGSFIAASYYSDSHQLKKCLADNSQTNSFCYKKFLG